MNGYGSFGLPYGIPKALKIAHRSIVGKEKQLKGLERNKMSTTYNAMVVYGWKVDVKPQIESVIKYDEDTGTPYTKKVETGYKVVIGDCEIPLTVIEELQDQFKFNMKIYTSPFYKGRSWIGRIVACTDTDNVKSDDQYITVFYPEQDQVINAVRHVLKLQLPTFLCIQSIS